MPASPIEVVGQWLQNLLDPDVVNHVVAPDATYVSLKHRERRTRQDPAGCLRYRAGSRVGRHLWRLPVRSDRADRDGAFRRSRR